MKMDAADITATLKKILDFLGLPYSDLKTSQEEDILRVDIVSPQASKLIGWHGETLNSLQHLVKAMVRSQQKLEGNPFIVLDVDGYRRMQEDKVRRITEQKADFVRRTGNRVALAPMSPYFRRIVHLHVANNALLQDLTTESAGEGDYRQVVLRLKQARSASGGSHAGAPVKNEPPEGEELSPVIAKDEGLENLDI